MEEDLRRVKTSKIAIITILSGLLLMGMNLALLGYSSYRNREALSRLMEWTDPKKSVWTERFEDICRKVCKPCDGKGDYHGE